MQKFDRIARLIGEDAMQTLSEASVAVIGVGGVGSFAAEGLVRSGVGSITLVDSDFIEITNVNRQLHATIETVGKSKVQVMKERLLSINPNCDIDAVHMRYSCDADFDVSVYDYVLDCIDSIQDKVELIVCCKLAGVRIISCMGAGNRLDPTSFRVMDIYSTKNDPLAKVMRSRLRKRQIEELTVVCSTEEPKRLLVGEDEQMKRIPGSAVFTTSVAGMIMAAYVVNNIAAHVE